MTYNVSFPALFYVICASDAEQSLTTILPSCVGLSSMTICFRKYQVEFCKAVTSQLKFILSNNKAKLCFIYNVMRFTKIQFCSQGCYLIDFVDTTTTVRNFLRTEELISSFFKKTVKNELSFFYLGKLIHF